MTRGVLMFANNNAEINYFRIACANALMIQKNLNVPVTLITDHGTYDYNKTLFDEIFINKCFEKIITVDRNYNFINPRNFSDTAFSSKTLQFYNANHWEAYKLSPYDETLFIDADYLIMSSALNNCWESDNEVMMNKSIISPSGNEYVRFVDDFGIKMYWATVIYFRKSDFAKFLFDMVRDIQENYTFYKDLYCFASPMFRNDSAFSIAIHMLNGFSEDSSIIGQLPISPLLMSWDTGDIHSINGINDITLFSEKHNMSGEYILVRLKNQDVHIMNKWAIDRHADKLINLYKELV
jgi:hypothetical protein